MSSPATAPQPSADPPGDAGAHRPAFPTRARLELHQELHARPALPARAPCVVSAWVQWGMAPAQAEAALASLCLAEAAAPPPAGVRHHVLHARAYVLKYERHGEFVSWQVNRPLPPLGEDPSTETLRATLEEASALPALPAAFVALLNGEGAGQLVAAAHVVMLDAAADEALLGRCERLLSEAARLAGAKTHDDSTALMGSFVGDARKGALLTTLRLGPDGFVRFVLLDHGMAPDQAAREAQRLCEIEGYRMLAMLGFPLAQAESQRLAGLERTLQATVDTMANDSARDDAAAFDTLSRLAAEVEHSTASTRFRLSATQAYRRLVERRLADLREQRIPGVQTLGGFLSRRFAPAMTFCENTDGRLTDMAERINRAVSLARVRVEQRREETNQELLRALAHRQHLQLRLQQTVEGLSVVAISYYTLGVVGYLAKALKLVPGLAGLSTDAVVAAAVVPVLVGVAWFVRRLRQHIEG